MRNFAKYYLLSMAVALLPVAGCQKREPIRLGFVAGLTSRSADLGTAGRNGAILAVEQRNAAGGICDVPVELVVRDDRQDPATARMVVHELIGLRVAAIIGPMTSSMAMATVPEVNASKIVMVSPTVTTDALTGKDDNFFRVISTTSEYAAEIARFQYRLGCRRAAAIYDVDNEAYTLSWLNDFGAAFESIGGRMIKKTAFRSGSDGVFFHKVRELLAVKPDVLMVICNAVDAAVICQQVRKLDGKVRLGLSEWAATERVIELGGPASEGVYLDQYFNRDDTSARYTSFLRSYRQRFGLEPGFAGVAAYDAANVVLDALAVKGDKQTLKECLLGRADFPGIQQTISFDRFGDAHRKTYLTTIRNGKFVTVE